MGTRAKVLSGLGRVERKVYTRIYLNSSIARGAVSQSGTEGSSIKSKPKGLLQTLSLSFVYRLKVVKRKAFGAKKG